MRTNLKCLIFLFAIAISLHARAADKTTCKTSSDMRGPIIEVTDLHDQFQVVSQNIRNNISYNGNAYNKIALNIPKSSCGLVAGSPVANCNFSNSSVTLSDFFGRSAAVQASGFNGSMQIREIREAPELPGVQAPIVRYEIRIAGFLNPPGINIIDDCTTGF